MLSNNYWHKTHGTPTQHITRDYCTSGPYHDVPNTCVYSPKRCQNVVAVQVNLSNCSQKFLLFRVNYIQQIQTCYHCLDYMFQKQLLCVIVIVKLPNISHNVHVVQGGQRGIDRSTLFFSISV